MENLNPEVENSTLATSDTENEDAKSDSSGDKPSFSTKEIFQPVEKQSPDYLDLPVEEKKDIKKSTRRLSTTQRLKKYRDKYPHQQKQSTWGVVEAIFGGLAVSVMILLLFIGIAYSSM